MRDGTVSSAGCAFCDARGSASFHGKQGRGAEITEQIRSKIEPLRARFGASRFLAYFQSYTNTYGDVSYLREIYHAALTEPGISGLAIGTRPDCLADPVLEVIEEFARASPVSLDLGVQSFENPTLEWLTRGHDRRSSIDALERVARLAPHAHVCVHLIFGAPTDSPRCPREAARLLNDHGVRGAKLHQLMVLENTELARRYRAAPFPTLSLEAYGERVLEFLTYLSPGTYIERLCATATHPEECIAPEWSRGRWAPHNRLREFLAARACRQGLRASDASATGNPT